MLTKLSLLILLIGSICILTQSLSIPESETGDSKDGNSEKARSLKPEVNFNEADNFKQIFASPPIILESAFEGRLLNVSHPCSRGLSLKVDGLSFAECDE